MNKDSQDQAKQDAQTADQAKDDKIKTVPLPRPFDYGGQTIDKIQMRRPDTGDLRGLNFRTLNEYDVDQGLTLVQRITTTSLPDDVIETMDGKNTMKLVIEAVNFLN